jgi:hypothetical protein
MSQEQSTKRTSIMSAYEPIEGEFRERAYKSWRNKKAGSNLYGFRWRYKEPDAECLPSPEACYVGIEFMEMGNDLYPRDVLAYAVDRSLCCD